MLDVAAKFNISKNKVYDLGNCASDRSSKPAIKSSDFMKRPCRRHLLHLKGADLVILTSTLSAISRHFCDRKAKRSWLHRRMTIVNQCCVFNDTSIRVVKSL